MLLVACRDIFMRCSLIIKLLYGKHIFCLLLFYYSSDEDDEDDDYNDGVGGGSWHPLKHVIILWDS